VKILKKISIILEVIIIVTNIALGYGNKGVRAQGEQEKPVKVDVLLYRFDDAYISLVRQSLEDIQKKNEGKIEFTFYDGKDDQSIQNQTIDTLLENKSTDLLLVNLVDVKSAQEVINKIKQENIPVILFNREPLNMDAVQSYAKAYFVGTNAEEAGVLQGEILINEWNSNKVNVDKNKDNIMQYIMLKGERNNLEAIARTKYSVSTINDAGITTQELDSQFDNWDKEQARNTTKMLLSRLGNNIEVIIANNDAMAIGAIEALQESGYNNGDKARMIPVVGVDAIPEAIDLIKKGFMTGTVIQDAPAMAQALYTVGMNLIHNKNPLDGTEYKSDDTGVAIRIPYHEYINK